MYIIYILKEQIVCKDANIIHIIFLSTNLCASAGKFGGNFSSMHHDDHVAVAIPSQVNRLIWLQVIFPYPP